MPILDAALAFALTMLVVATAVTRIVQLAQKLANLRNAQLKKMLTEYFHEHLEPVLTRELNRLNHKAAGKVGDEMFALAKKKLDNTEMFSADELSAIVEVSTQDLGDRIERSALGQKLVAELGDEADKIFAELAKRYETLGEKFTKSFREHSRRWATVAALLLALAVNIDSIHIASAYIRNESLREGVAAEMNAVVGKYQAATQGNIDLQADAQALQEQVAYLTESGLPIGWSLFPHDLLGGYPSHDGSLRNNLGGWVTWGLGILLTAVLAGLGAPFWYDAVTGISRFTQRARAAKTAAS